MKVMTINRVSKKKANKVIMFYITSRLDGRDMVWFSNNTLSHKIPKRNWWHVYKDEAPAYKANMNSLGVNEWIREGYVI